MTSDTDSLPTTGRTIAAAVLVPLLKRFRRRHLTAMAWLLLGSLTIGAIALLAYVHGTSPLSLLIFSALLFTAAIAKAIQVSEVRTVQRMLNDGARVVHNNQELSATLVATRYAIKLDAGDIAELLAADKETPSTNFADSSSTVAPILEKIQRSRLIVLILIAIVCITLGAVTALTYLHAFAFNFVLVLLVAFVVLLSALIAAADAVRKVSKLRHMLHHGSRLALNDFTLTATLHDTQCSITLNLVDHCAILLAHSKVFVSQLERLTEQRDADDIAYAAADAAANAERAADAAAYADADAADIAYGVADAVADAVVVADAH
jgi:hypothetical protein